MYFSTQKRMVHVTVTATKNNCKDIYRVLYMYTVCEFYDITMHVFIEFFKCMILMSLCMYVVCVGVSLKWHKPFHVHIHLVHSGKIYMCYKSPHFIMTHEIMHCTS